MAPLGLHFGEQTYVVPLNEHEPIRGRLEDPKNMPEEYPGWRWLQCTDYPGQFRILIPPKIASIYARLLEAEGWYELNTYLLREDGRPDVAWERVAKLQAMKSKMLRRCMRIIDFHPYDPEISFESEPAPPKPASPQPAPVQSASLKKHAPAQPASPKPTSPQLVSSRPAPLQPATGDNHVNYSAQPEGPASSAHRSSSAASSNRSESNRIIIYCPEDYRVERYNNKTWRSIDRIPVVPQVATETKPVTPQNVLPAQKAATSPSISPDHRKAAAESKSRAASEVPASQTVPSGDNVVDDAAANRAVRPEAVSALNNKAMITVYAMKEPSLHSSPPAPLMLLISALEPEAVLMAQQKPSPPSPPRGSPTSLTMRGTRNDAAAHSDQSIYSSARKVQQMAKETTMERSRAEPPSLTEGHFSGRNGDEREVNRPIIEFMRPAVTSARGGVSIAATPETTTRTWPGASTTPATAIPQGPQTSYGYGVGNGMSTGSLLDEKYLLRAPAMSNRSLVGGHGPGVVGTMDMRHAQYDYQRPRYQQMKTRDDKSSDKGWVSKTISFMSDLATGKYRWKGPLLVKRTAHNPPTKVMPSTSAVEFVHGGYMQGRVQEE